MPERAAGGGPGDRRHRDPQVGEKNFLGAVALDPTTQTADLTARRRNRVCLAYAPAIDAPIDEVHCFDASPNLWFAPASWRESLVKH